MAKYFTIDGYETAAGLTHHTGSLRCLLKSAYQRNAIPLIPRFRLAGHHNHGRELLSDLSKYYDYDRLTINGNKYRIGFSGNTAIPEAEIERVIVDHRAVEAVQGVLWDLREFRDVDRSGMILPYHHAIIQMAQEIAQRLQPYTCICVRRGDRVTDSQIDADLSCPNILDKIKKCGLTTAYIMTNEDLSFFDPLRSTRHNILFYNDFSELATLDDNFLLFCIEKEIMGKATKRVSSFKVLEYSPEKDYYDFCLTQAVGFS